MSSAQLAICHRFEADPATPADDTKVGVSKDLRKGWPLNGPRHEPEGDTNGWYLWVGDVLSEADDFTSRYTSTILLSGGRKSCPTWHALAACCNSRPPGIDDRGLGGGYARGLYGNGAPPASES